MSRYCIALIIALLLVGPGVAQSLSPSPAVNYPVLVMFVKNALTAVNHGNITGNYTVLRDLGSDAFRARNSAADLATAFANQRAEKFDLSPILVAEPQFTQPPAEIKPGLLKLVGFFPTQPRAVQFAVVYQRSDKGWAIDEISLGIVSMDSLVQPSAPVSQKVEQVQYLQH